VTDVINNIRTNFTANTAGFVNPVSAMVGASSSAVGTVRNLVSSITGLPGMLAGVAAGFGIHSIIEVNDAFTKTQRTIGGTFAALGLASDFNAGLSRAAATMAEIERDAAILPGEASDYVDVFQAALPNMSHLQGVIQAGGQSMAQFSNRFAAVAVTFGVDMSQAGRDLARMLQDGHGQVEALSQTWMKMSPFIQDAAQSMGLNVASARDFNALTAQQRAQLIQSTVNQGGLNGMLQAAGHSWEAQLGTIQSIGKNLLRQSSQPIYEGIVTSLEQVNTFLDANTGKIVALGQAIGRYVVGGFQQAGAMIAEMGKYLDYAVALFNQSGIMESLSGAGRNIMGAVGNLAQQAAGEAQGGALDPYKWMNVLMETAAPLAQTFENFTAIIEPVGSALIGLYATFSEIQANLLPPLANAIMLITEPMFAFWGSLAGIVGTLINNVRPTFVMLSSKIGGLVTSIASFLHPAMRLIGAAFTWIADKLGRFLAPVIQVAGDVIGGMIDAISRFISWLGSILSTAANRILGPAAGRTAPSGSAPNAQTQALDAAAQAQAEAAAAQEQAARPTPGGRGGGGTHQDFRGSRFEITQKYAEGYDPDRVAVAFASDLARIGEYRLQSGLAPLYGLR